MDAFPARPEFRAVRATPFCRRLAGREISVTSETWCVTSRTWRVAGYSTLFTLHSSLPFYRLLYWKRLRAPFCPYFLRSFIRESRVRKPFLRNP
jgi:hypothetical protein